MTSNIPDIITYFGIEFSKDMTIDKKEISVKGSIFSIYDSNKDGRFNDTEWETFSNAVEQENQMRQRLIDQRNNVTIKKYNNKIEQAKDKINNLIRESQKYGDIWKEFEEFVEQHPYFNQLQVIGDNEVPPDGVEIFDISALGIGYQEESGQCYQKGYFPEGVSIPEEELVKYRRFISKLKEYQAWSQEISAQIKDLTEEISQNSLLKDLAEEGAISQTQTSYQDEQTYQRYKSRIRSPENPFWSQINALEIRQNSLIAECKKAPQGANSAANIDNLQREIEQISDQLKQLNLASRQWFINTYGKSGNSSKQTGAGSAEELLRLAVSNNGNLSAISGSVGSLSIDEKQETSLSKTDKVLEVTSKDEIVQTLSDKEDAQAEAKVSGVTSKDEKVQTLSDKEDAQADESAAEENPLNPAFSHMYNPKSLREDALGTPQDSGISVDTSQVSVNQSTSSTSNGVTSNLSSSYSFGLTSIDVVQAMEKANKDSVPDGAKSMLSGDNLISSENEKIAEDNIEVIKTSESDSSDSSLTGSSDNGNSVPVISTNPTSFSGSVAGSVNYTVHADEGVDVNLHAGGNLSTSVAGDNFSSNGRTDVGIEVTGMHDKASVSASISGGLSTESQGDETSIHASSPSYSADLNYSHNDEHLTIEASGSVTIQDTSKTSDGAEESGSLSVTPQGNIYINYNKDRFSVSSTGSFSLTNDTTTANGSVNLNAGRFNFSSSFSHTKMTMETPKLVIPEELLSLNGLDLSDISSSTASNTTINNNFTASTGYQDGNLEASASYQLSQTNDDSSNTGNILGKWKFDRDYVTASATFTDVSSSFSVGMGSNIVHQQKVGNEFSLQPEGTIGYSIGDHALTFNGSANGSLMLTRDNGTVYNFSLMESFNSRIYTDGSGSYHNNMLVLNGSVTSGHVSGNLSLTHSFTYNHNASGAKDTSLTKDFLSGDLSKLDFSSVAIQTESPVDQYLTIGGGLSYHQDDLTLYVNGSVGVGQNAPSPTVTLGLNWNLGGLK